MSAHVLQLFPELTNVNGDAENALVLVRRLAWAGVDASVVPVAAGEEAPSGKPLAVVLGSGVDSALQRTRDALEVVRDRLEGWVEDGVPVLAVGTGCELLGRAVPVGGDEIEGLHLYSGETTPLPARAAGDLVVETPWGTLVGYENHARGLVLASPAEPLGTVTRGVGNGEGAEGVRWGSLVGTHAHGPVLARNPWLADRLLELAGVEAGPSEEQRRVDALADALRRRVTPER